MASGGWVKLYRKLLENPIFLKPDLLQLFLYCILKANHEPTNMIWNGKEITIQRGQFITGRDVLSLALEQKPTTTYKRLKLLENLRFLNIKSNNKFSLVTVVNYELYQMTDEESDSKSNNKGTTKEQQRNTNKNDKNYKNDKKDPSGSSEIFSTYQKLTGDNNIERQQRVQSYLDKGLDAEVIVECIRDSLMGEFPQKYVFGILDKCVFEQVTTLTQYIDRKKAHNRKQEEFRRDVQQKKAELTNRMTNRTNFDQREYDEEEIGQFYITASNKRG